MTRISNYDELVAERIRIENTIIKHKSSIIQGTNDLKDKLEPFLYLLPVLSVFKKNNSVLKVAASLALNAFIGNKTTSNSGWLAKFVIPILKRII